MLMFSPRPLLLAACVAAGLAGATAATPALAAPSTPAATVRDMATAIDFRFGAAVDREALGDAAYADLLDANVTTLSTRDELTFATVQPQRGTFDFAAAEEVVDFAEAHGLTVRGHDLVTPDRLPEWITTGTWDATTLADALREHVTTVIAHFERRNPGVVTDWDVVGRALLPDGTLRPSVLQAVLGDEYLRIAFDAARAAAPAATLYYDDFYDDVAITQEAVLAGQPIVPGASATTSTCGEIPKCAGTSALLTSLLDRGAPIDGVAFEAHVFSPEPVDMATFTAWVGDLGLVWAVSEFTVPLPATEIATPSSLEFQADTYRAALGACVDAPECDTFVTWGITDRLSPLSVDTDGVYDGALWLDAADQPKPARDAIRDVFSAIVAQLPAPTTTAPPAADVPAAATEIAPPVDTAIDDGDHGDGGEGEGMVVPVAVGLAALAAIGGLILILRRRSD
jgi:endo-1,4-beta-xylanase